MQFPNLPTRIEGLEVSDFDIEVKNPYVLNQVNISSAFRMYQRDIALLNASGGLLVESNPHELLAVNNILLLKPGQHSNMMMKHFTEETFKNIHKDVATKFGIEDKEFDQEKKLAIEKILKVSSVVHCLTIHHISYGCYYRWSSKSCSKNPKNEIQWSSSRKYRF